MNNLQVITTETLTKLTKKRVGETKFFEDAKYLTNSTDLSTMLSDTSLKFVVFGIKEDIGVLANQGLFRCKRQLGLDSEITFKPTK